jgi:quercetin dioxygenase-like cupin family protein
MESIMPPDVRGMAAHSHSGPEAFYVLSGAQCLETQDGTTVTRAGASAIMHSGHQMALNGVGAENRKAVLIVLHNSALPWITRAAGTWTPPDRCPR